MLCDCSAGRPSIWSASPSSEVSETVVGDVAAAAAGANPCGAAAPRTMNVTAKAVMDEPILASDFIRNTNRDHIELCLVNVSPMPAQGLVVCRHRARR